MSRPVPPDRSPPSAPAARRDPPPLAAIEAEIAAIGDRLAATAVAPAPDEAHAIMATLLVGAEHVLVNWLVARGDEPVAGEREGFRLLALHRQGARGEPSFNACRESARELCYYANLVAADPDHPDTKRRLRLAAMVARHFCLFVTGKLETAGLGEFCCAAKPLRTDAARDGD